MAQVLYRFGTQDQYNALAVKDANTLYFISDTRRIYKGEVLHGSNDLEVVSNVPEFASAQSGKLYVVFSTSGVVLYVKGETEMMQAGGGKVQAGAISDISAFDSALLDKAAEETDSKIPTSAKVAELISAAVAEYDGAFVDVSSATASPSGTVLSFSKKDGTTKEVTIADMFLTSASYNAVTHILTLTVQGQEAPIEVDLAELVPQAVSTADVAISEKIVVTTDVGNLKKGQEIDPTSTKDLQALLVSMLSQDSNPTAVQPSANITLTGAGNVEVGTTFTPKFSASLSSGSYSANGKTQASGVTAETYAFTDSDGHSIDAGSAASGEFAPFVVEDGDNYTVTVAIAHTQGDMPKTFLGKDYPDARISEGTKSKTSSAVKAYRRTFYGTLTSKSGEINSALVRGLATKTNSALANGSKFDITVPVGALRIMVAYPASLRDLTSVTSKNQFGSAITGNFTANKTIVSVDGAAVGTGTDYKVFFEDLASPVTSADVYTVQI